MKNIKIAVNKIEEVLHNGYWGISLANLHLNEIPVEITKLKDLKYLSIRNNSFTEIPSIVFELTNLERLDISYNDITEIPDEISKLSKLVTLRAIGNKISDITPLLANCNEITTLYFGSNDIRVIPDTLADLTKLKIIELSGNNYLISPPIEIVNQGINAFLNYLNSIRVNKRSIDNYEAKLIIVGEGNVGKTCIKERLVSNKFIEKSDTTHGIKISQWNTVIRNHQDFRINIWDFGGQEIYHATHQYFLTKRSLYLLIWNARTDDDIYWFDKWLNMINSLSNNSPILLIQNKIDERQKKINEQLIVTKYPNVVGFIDVSSKTGEGIKELSNSIKENIFRLEHIGSKLPAAWVDIRKKLESINKKYINNSEYLKICSEHNLTQENSNYLSDYFHDIGVFLHFKDNFLLKDIVFIDPTWATNSVYSLIDNTNIILKFGEFDLQTLEIAWKSYPSNLYPALLELMLRFEICFKYSDSNKYIVPSLLQENQPNILVWEEKEDLVFIYEYNHVTSNILSRFIVKTYDLIDDKMFWKYGVVLNNEFSKALIIYNPFEKQIKIKVQGIEKYTLFEIIRREFDNINKTINLKPNELVPCKCSKCSHSDNKYYWSFVFLRTAKNKKIGTVLCQKYLEDVSTDALLFGFDNNIKSEESEILKILYELRKEITDDNKFMVQANKIIELKPNIFGVGIDINALIKKFIKK